MREKVQRDEVETAFGWERDKKKWIEKKGEIPSGILERECGVGQLREKIINDSGVTKSS